MNIYQADFSECPATFYFRYVGHESHHTQEGNAVTQFLYVPSANIHGLYVIVQQKRCHNMPRIWWPFCKTVAISVKASAKKCYFQAGTVEIAAPMANM